MPRCRTSPAGVGKIPVDAAEGSTAMRQDDRAPFDRALARARSAAYARGEIAAALAPGGRFAFTLEEGAPLTAAERAVMPDADTVWLTPLDELAGSLRRAGLVVTWQEDHSRAHAATAQALAAAFAADAEA